MDHVRIDEGLKRGPKQRPGQKSPRQQNGRFLQKLSNEPAVIIAALEEYRAGATLQQIATKHSVTKEAIYAWLLGNLGGSQHTDIVTEALTSRIAKADELLESADNPLTLARARELCRFYRMDLERRRPHLYGQKQEVTHRLPDGPVISINCLVAPPASQQSLPAPVEALSVTDDDYAHQ